MKAWKQIINLYKWLRIQISKWKKKLPHFKRTVWQPRNFVIVLLKAWVKRLFRSELFLAAGPFLEACPVPCAASLPEAAASVLRSLPRHSHPYTYSLSSSSNWICPSPGAPGEDCEFSSWEDWSYIHSQAGERCCDTWLHSSKGLWSTRSLTFRMNEMKEYGACTNSFKFKDSAPEE